MVFSGKEEASRGTGHKREVTGDTTDAIGLVTGADF